jgi:hypothetical protein
MDDAYAALIFPLLTVLLLPAIAISVIRAAASGALGRNGGFGIRTRDTQSSDASWIAGHKAALPTARRTWWIAIAAVPSTFAAQVLLDGVAGILVAMTGLLVQTAMLLYSAKAANAAARAADAASCHR